MSDTIPCNHWQFTEHQSYCPDCGLSRAEALVAACDPFLKDGETPAECIARNRRDVDGCLSMLIAEKRKSEALAARLASVERERDEIMAMAERRESKLQARLAEAEAEALLRELDDCGAIANWMRVSDDLRARIDAFLAADSADGRNE